MTEREITVTFSTTNVMDARKRQHGATDLEVPPQSHPMFAAAEGFLCYHFDSRFDPSTDRFEGVLVRDGGGAAFYYTRKELIDLFPDVADEIRIRLITIGRENGDPAPMQKSWF